MTAYMDFGGLFGRGNKVGKEREAAPKKPETLTPWQAVVKASLQNPTDKTYQDARNILGYLGNKSRETGVSYVLRRIDPSEIEKYGEELKKIVAEANVPDTVLNGNDSEYSLFQVRQQESGQAGSETQKSTLSCVLLCQKKPQKGQRPEMFFPLSTDPKYTENWKLITKAYEELSRR